MMKLHMMKRAAAVLLATTVLSAGALAQGQETAAPDLPESRAGQENEPNWPPGLESWDSEERDPENVNPDAAEELGLTQPEVQDDAPPPPNEQGMRPPEPLIGPDEREQMSLYEMLNLVRNAPPGLEGQTVPRPNVYGSEPTTEMEPIGGPDYLFPEGYVE